MMTAEMLKPIADFKAYMISAGYDPSLADDYAFKLKRMFELTIRLIPAAMIMSHIMAISWLKSPGLFPVE